MILNQMCPKCLYLIYALLSRNQLCGVYALLGGHFGQNKSFHKYIFSWLWNSTQNLFQHFLLCCSFIWMVNQGLSYLFLVRCSPSSPTFPHTLLPFLFIHTSIHPSIQVDSFSMKAAWNLKSPHFSNICSQFDLVSPKLYHFH